MASPQVENGFTRIANELLEAVIRAELPAVQTRIVLIIMRETYGYQRKTVRMGYQSLSTTYGIARTLLIREMAALVERNILVKESSATGNTWGVQKDYTQWLGSHRRVTSPPAETSHQNRQRLVTAERPVTSHSTVTTSKKEKKERNDDDVVADAPAKNTTVVGGLIDIGLTPGQSINAVKQNSSLSVSDVRRCEEWLASCKADNPIGILVGFLKAGKLPPAPRSNGRTFNSAREMTPFELEAHMHGA